MTTAPRKPDAPGTGLTARERHCNACGTTSKTLFERCPACGARYDAPSPGRGRRRALLATVAGAAVVAASVVGVVLALGAKSDREARERADFARAVEHERARLQKLQAPHRGGAPELRPASAATDAERLAARRALVVAVEAAITANARRRAEAGELEGPIVRTECGPILRDPEAVPDDRDLGKDVGRYDCVAVRRDVAGATGSTVAALGYAYVTALDFERFRWTFCRNTPAQGERGKALAHVRLDRACLAARGRALGSGYVDTE